MIQDFSDAYGLSYAILRYFNASGASADGEHGEHHVPETHLIPLIIEAVQGKREIVELYGDNYETSDGTCLRDYVHVEDLAQAHEIAVTTCPQPGEGGRIMNIGTGTGNTVMEVVRAVEEVTGKKVPYRVTGRRPGDPARLVASNDRLRELGWKPRFDTIKKVVETAWKWHTPTPGRLLREGVTRLLAPNGLVGSLLEILGDDVDQALVSVFGDSVVVDRDPHDVVCQLSEFAPLESHERDGRGPFFLRVAAGLYDVRRVAARADQQDRVAGLQVVDELPANGIFVAEIVGQCGQHRDVRDQGDGPKGGLAISVRALRRIANGVVGDRSATPVPGDPDGPAACLHALQHTEDSLHGRAVEGLQCVHELSVVVVNEGLEVAHDAPRSPRESGQSDLSNESNESNEPNQANQIDRHPTAPAVRLSAA